jgi:2-iminobutanoate/2-iminopropanoate deaminase
MSNIPTRVTANQGARMKTHLQKFGFGMPWEEAYGFSQAIRNGSILYISGQLSHGMDANFIGEDDFELQVQTTFANIDRVLEAYGARKDQIVETMVYVKNLRENFEDIARLHREYFGDHRPTSTLLGVVELAQPPQLVEISAVAILDEDADID